MNLKCPEYLNPVQKGRCRQKTNTGKILNSWKLLLKCSKWLSEYGGIYFGSSRWRVKTEIEEFSHHHHHRHHHHHHQEDDSGWGGIRLLSLHVYAAVRTKSFEPICLKREFESPQWLSRYISTSYVIVHYQISYITMYSHILPCIIVYHIILHQQTSLKVPSGFPD